MSTMIHSTSRVDDDEAANLEWVLEQSKREYETQQELLANAAVNSEEEYEAVEKAIAASQEMRFQGPHHNSRDRPSDGAEEAQECGSPGCQLVCSSYWSSRENGTLNASTPTKSKEQTNSTKNDFLLQNTKSPKRRILSHVQRTLSDMYSSPKKKKFEYECSDDDGFSPLSPLSASTSHDGLTGRIGQWPSLDITKWVDHHLVSQQPGNSVASVTSTSSMDKEDKKKKKKKIKPNLYFDSPVSDARCQQGSPAQLLKQNSKGIAARRQRPPLHVYATVPPQPDSSPSSTGSATSVTHIQFSPHPSTLTKSGDRSFGGGCHEAVAEFIDNGIEASREQHKKEIYIHLFVASDDEKKAAIAVCDYGKGMTKRDIEDFACYSYNIGDRRGEERPYQTSNESRHIDGRLSVYGVGSKNAAFHLGSRLTVITKTKQANQMSVFCMDSMKLHSSFEKNEDMYRGHIYDCDPQDVGCLNEAERQDVNIAKMVKKFSSSPHFTIILIGGLKREHINFLRKHYGRDFRRGLAHIYHFYLHGSHGRSTVAERRDQHDGLSLIVTYYLRGGETKAFDLSGENDDVESLYQLNAKGSYNFSIDLRIEEKSGDKVYPVQGLLLYFPSTLADGETIPSPYDKHELFECFWQGRLIPRTVIPCLDFCKLKKPRVAAQRDKLPDSCFKRLKGLLFFDRTMLTGHNKLSLLLPSDVLTRRLNDCIHKREEKKFCDWLSKCHKCLDEEWVFLDETEVGSGQYRTLQLSGSVGCVLREGDYICVKRTNPHMYGKIKYFSKDKDSVFISRHPCKMYPWVDEVSIPRLDFKHCHLDQDQWQKAIEEQSQKMPEHLVVGCLEGGLYNLTDVAECTPSTAVSAEGFWISLYDGNGDPVKRLPGHKRDLIVAMKVQSPRNEFEIEGSTEGFGKFTITDAGQHTFKFTVINRAKKSQESESQDVKLLELEHTISVVADLPSVICVMDASNDVRLGSKEFSLDVDVLDKYKNPCKGIGVNVALCCSNKGLQASAPSKSITTDENGRFCLCGVQFIPRDVNAARTTSLTGMQTVTLVVNDTIKQKVKVKINSGIPAKLQLVEPLSVVKQNSVGSLAVKVLDAFNLAATVHRDDAYRVSARFLTAHAEGMSHQFTEILKPGSSGHISFNNLKFVFPDNMATVGQVELSLLQRTTDDENSKEVAVCTLVCDVNIVPSCQPVCLILYDEDGKALSSNDVLVASVGSVLNLRVEAFDVQGKTVDLLEFMLEHANTFLQTSWSKAAARPQSMNTSNVDNAQLLRFPPLPVPQKADSIISHYVLLKHDGVEIVKSVVKIQPQPDEACQVVIEKQRRSTMVGCGNEGELRNLLRFFLVDQFGNKVNVDETTDVRALLDDADDSECYLDGDWCLERKVVSLDMGENISRSYTQFQLPTNAVVVGLGKATISACVPNCDMAMSCSLKIQPGHPTRVEVQSNGFEDAQSFSDRHTLQFIRDQPLPVINAMLVDMGGNEVKRSKSHQYSFTAEIQECGRTYKKITFETSIDDPLLELPPNLTAQAFTIMVKAEIEEEIQPACISCLVRLTNRVTSIAVTDLNKELLTDQVKFDAGTKFPHLLVTVETEDGLVADIDWNDMHVTASSTGGHKIEFQLIGTRDSVGKYSYAGPDTLTEVGVYRVVAQLNDQREDLNKLYPASQLQVEHVGHITVLPGDVDRLMVTFPDGFGNGKRPIVISKGTTHDVILLPCQTLTSAVDAFGNVVDHFSGSLSFVLLPDGVPFNLATYQSHRLAVEVNFSQTVIESGRTVLTSPVELKLSEKRVVPGKYFLHVYSEASNRVVCGSVAVTVTAVETESIVRELQDREEKKQQLEDDLRFAESAFIEVESHVTTIRSRLQKLACIDSVDKITASNVKLYIHDVELKYDKLEKKVCRKPAAPKDFSCLQLPAYLQTVARGQLFDLAFIEEESYSRLISSHLGERLLSSVIFPTSEHVDKYKQAPHEKLPPAASLDIASQAMRESIKDDLIAMDVGLSWELAIDCVSTHDCDVRCLMCCLLKDTLITNSLVDAKQLLTICQNGNDMRAVPDILSLDGYRVTAAGFVERLLDGPAESKFVFGQEPLKASPQYREVKKAMELLKKLDDKLNELELRKRQHTEMRKRNKPLLDKLCEQMIKLKSQKDEVEQSTECY